MTDINLSELFGSNTSSKKGGAGEIGRGKDTGDIARSLDDILSVIEDDSRTINGFGFVEDMVFGSSNDPKENSSLQNIARGATSFRDKKLARTRTVRDNADSAFFEDVAKALEGQGQVSNFERQAGAASITNLKAAGIDDESARLEVNRLKDALEFRDFREISGVTIDQNGFETKDGQNVITYRGKDGGIYSQKVDKPTIYVPDWVGVEGIKSGMNSIEVGSQVYHKGKIYTKQPDSN